MKRPVTRNRRTNERGATLAEFAIILLCLLTTLFGLIEICRLALTYTTLATAARAATRYAIVHGPDRSGTGVDGPSSAADSSQVTAFAQNYTNAAGMNGSQLTVTVSYPNANSTDIYGNEIGSPVTVQLTYGYRPMLSLIPLTVTLNTTSEGIICF